MGALTAEEILNAQDVQVLELPVPEWGIEPNQTGDAGEEPKPRVVFVRSVDGKEREQLSFLAMQYSDRKQGTYFYAKAGVMLLCDADGNRLFNVSQVGALNNKSGAVVERLVDAGLRFNGLGKDADSDAEEN